MRIILVIFFSILIIMNESESIHIKRFQNIFFLIRIIPDRDSALSFCNSSADWLIDLNFFTVVNSFFPFWLNQSFIHLRQDDRWRDCSIDFGSFQSIRFVRLSSDLFSNFILVNFNHFLLNLVVITPLTQLK